MTYYLFFFLASFLALRCCAIVRRQQRLIRRLRVQVIRMQQDRAALHELCRHLNLQAARLEAQIADLSQLRSLEDRIRALRQAASPN